MSQYKKRKKKRAHWLVKLLILAVLVLSFAHFVPKITKNEIYPKHYEEYVLQYSEKYNIDENFVFAVIKTESNFNEKAQSDVGARGLMQIMEEAYDWVKFKIDDDREISYDQMFEAEFNIEYGSFMLGYYYEKYNSYELAAAAYHSGMGQVDQWISDGTLSPENLNVDDIPASKTRHYINKVMKAYNAYNNLYE